MRKLILLALALGMVELLKRRGTRMGLAPAAILAGAAEKGLNWLRRPEPAGKPNPSKNAD